MNYEPFLDLVRIIFICFAMIVSWENVKKDKHGRALICLLLAIVSIVNLVDLFGNNYNVFFQRVVYYITMFSVLIGIHLNGGTLQVENKVEKLYEKIIEKK